MSDNVSKGYAVYVHTPDCVQPVEPGNGCRSKEEAEGIARSMTELAKVRGWRLSYSVRPVSSWQLTSDWYESVVTEAANVGFRALMSGEAECVYLWFKQGGLTLSAEQPDPAWELGNGQGLRGDLTRDQLRARVWELARRLPCLPSES
jgi:hypothetical protein